MSTAAASHQGVNREQPLLSATLPDGARVIEFEQGHVTGAFHLPRKGHPDEDDTLRSLRAYPLVIVYDGESSCRLAESVAKRLRAAGISTIRILDGAWPAWLAAGGPGASGFCSECRHTADESLSAHPETHE